LKPGTVDLHLLAFKLRGDADHGNRYVGLLCRGYGFCNWIGNQVQPHQLRDEASPHKFGL
jgi:hypothetical protein